METIPDATLQALGFYHSSLGYLEEGVLWFVDVIEKLELAIEPEDEGYPITDSKDEKARKELERATKRKSQHDNLCALVQQAFIIGFATFSLSGSMLALLSFLFMSALLSCPGSLTPSLFCLIMPALSSLFVPALLSRLFVPALLSYFLALVLSSLLMLTLLSPLIPALLTCFVLNPAMTCLISSALRIFKQVLSDKLLGH